jgi:sulfide:quinone oxidoreductase
MSPPRVIVAGGGLAALEAVVTLRRGAAAERLPITMLAPKPGFVHRPMTTQAVLAHGSAWRVELERFARDYRVELVADSLASVDVGGHLGTTADGRRLPYSALLVAVGARTREWLPGAITFGLGEPGSGMPALLAAIDRGTVASVDFVLPPKAFWTPLLYDLALLTSHYARTRGRRTRLSLVTPERAPLGMFGPRASLAIVQRLRREGIELVLGAGPDAVTADRVVTLPALSGPAIDGLPCDDDGFHVTDEHGCVTGATDVYAAGDGAAFPIKQVGLTAREADAAGAAILAAHGAQVVTRPFRPVLDGLVVPSEDLYPEAERSWSLWWPPASLAAPTLSPYLSIREGGGCPPPPEAPPGSIPVHVELAPRSSTTPKANYDAPAGGSALSASSSNRS